MAESYHGKGEHDGHGAVVKRGGRDFILKGNTGYFFSAFYFLYNSWGPVVKEFKFKF